MPHLIEGRVIRQNRCMAFAPRLWAACSCSIPISSSTGTISRIISGSATKVVAMMMPGVEKMTWKPMLDSVGPNQPLRPL
jgi:hypothetical protein